MKTLFTEKSIPLLFAAITIVAYGLLLPFTGFYWDDWPFAWIAKFLGPRAFNAAFAPFRPFLGPIFFATTSLIPPVPLYWQIFALVIRLLIGLAAWWMFRQVWPKRQDLGLTTALLILVFPGYSQHWVAFTHINQELIPLIFYLFSFGYTFKALHSERPRTYIIIALLLQLCGIFPTEYFFGLEGIRGLLLLACFRGKWRQRLGKTLKYWWPHLIVWLLNAAWLIYYYRFGPYTSYEVTAAQSFSLLAVTRETLDALWKAGFYVWIQVLFLAFPSLPAPASLLSLGLAVISTVFLSVYLSRIDRSADNSISPLALIVIGTLAIMLGRLPSLAAGLPLTLQSSYDRFMVSMMIGGSLFILGLIELVFGKRRLKIHVLALIIALGIGQQFFNANIFRRDWTRQSEIYWQLAWRIPALEPGTVVLTHQMPIDYETDISFTAPINWLYAPNFQAAELPYLMLYTEKRLGGPTLPVLARDTEITFPYRTVTFHGNTSRAVVIYMPTNGCLRVLDPQRGDADIYGRESRFLVDAIPLSDLSRIITGAGSHAPPEFMIEPDHDWCYYFARAELAYQIGDFEKVMALEEAASSVGKSTGDPNEWLIFIEAYARTGDLGTAERLSQVMLGEDTRATRGLCVVWQRVRALAPAGSAGQVGKILSQLDCDR